MRWPHAIATAQWRSLQAGAVPANLDIVSLPDVNSIKNVVERYFPAAQRRTGPFARAHQDREPAAKTGAK
jgi:hypothetical protein